MLEWRWNCGYVSGMLCDLCPLHGGCLEGSEAIGTDEETLPYRCPFCNKNSMTRYHRENETVKHCHSCHKEESL